MCGLVSILDWKAGDWGLSLYATRAVDRGLKAMAHRGLPGRSLVVQEGNTILGHTRLPIINLDKYFDQPFERGGTVGVFVGEIFNYKKLYNKDFNSCDVQTIFDFFNTWGLRNFHAFDGFWSCVFVKDKKVTVVTDYLSQKPLYFHPERMIVASEPMAIRAALNYPLEIDEVYMSNVLKWGYSPDYRTPWKGIQQLPAGVALTYPPGPTLTPYWEWSEVPLEFDLKALLVEATQNRLVGDRPVATLLSGGLDSTIIYKLLQSMNVEIFPYYVVNGVDEEYINNVTQDYFSLKTTSVTVPEAIKAHQVPVDLGSMLPQLALAKALRLKGYYVAMSGDGADELFGGYRRAQEYDSQASDVFMELPFYHMPRLDRLMMNQTVELRSPYLAPKVVRHALNLTWSKRTQKQALKEAFKDIVPQKILDRAKHPLKSNEVITGKIEYRKELIRIWMEQWK